MKGHVSMANYETDDMEGCFRAFYQFLFGLMVVGFLAGLSFSLALGLGIYIIRYFGGF